jgi:hypothetical protein
MYHNLKVVTPPKSYELISGLRVTITFHTSKDFKISLRHLDKILSITQPYQVLLQVSYPINIYSDDVQLVVKQHVEWQKRYPQYSTFIPICLDPHQIDIQQWATPEQCDLCIFREGKRCDGLQYKSYDSQSRKVNTLQSLISNNTIVDTHEFALTHWKENLTVQDFANNPPCAYWMPQVKGLNIIQSYLERYQCQSLWDIGGGNGVIASIIQHSTGITTTVIDPLADLYAPIPSVQSIACTAEHALSMVQLGKLSVPDAILVSWPTPSMFYDHIIALSQVKVFILADDKAGFCGVNSEYRQLEYNEGLVRCFAYPKLERMQAWECVYENEIMCYRDLQTSSMQSKKDQNTDCITPPPWQGRLRIFTSINR